MTELGKIAVRDEQSVLRIRERFFQLSLNLNFSEFQAARISSALSELAQQALKDRLTLVVSVSLVNDDEQNGLLIHVNHLNKALLPQVRAVFPAFDHCSVSEKNPGELILILFKQFTRPGLEFSAHFLRQQKQLVGQLSVEELYEKLNDVHGQLDKERTAAQEVQRYSAKIIESVQEGIVLLNQKWEILSVNSSFMEMFDLEKAPHEGQPLAELLRQRCDVAMLPLLRKRLRKQPEDTVQAELSVETARGLRACLIKARQIHYPIEQIDAILLNVKDITLQKEVEQQQAEAQQAIIHSERKFRRLFEESRDAIYFSTPEGRIVDMNPAGVALLGYSSCQELIRDIRGAALYKDPSDRERLLRRLMKNGHVKDYEVVLKRKDGKEITALITASAISDGREETTLIQGIIRDITRQKELQEQLLHAQKMEAIGALAGGIAHDFNNILGAQIGYAELLKDELSGNPHAQMHLEGIYKASLRAKDLVSQILTFSRKTKSKLAPVQFAFIVREALQLLQPSVPPSVKITGEIEDKSGVVIGDAVQLHQLIMNLCTNAFQALTENGGEVAVQLVRKTFSKKSVRKGVKIPAGDYVMLTVSDNGPGIPKEHLSQIFEPFFTTKPKGEGTGLGLALVHGIVNTHKGFITVSSKIGKGTVFEIFLPRDDGRLAVEEPGKQHHRVNSGMILLVDDEPAVAGVTAERLRKIGFTVDVAVRPEVALELFQKAPDQYDLLLTDHAMPGINGIELVGRIRAIREDLPVILMTGFGDSALNVQVEAHRINAQIHKPFLTKDLEMVIAAVLPDPIIEEE